MNLAGRIPDRAFFHEFVRAMFFHRRKFLRSELASAFKGQFDKNDADEIMHVARSRPYDKGGRARRRRHAEPVRELHAKLPAS